MPDVTLPIRDLHASVERPVHLGVIKDLMEIVKISHKTPVNYYGVDSKASQHKSTLGDLSKSENRWGYDERVFVEVEEEFNKDYFYSTVLQRAEHLHTFWDDALGIYIKPVYSVNTVKVNFRYRAVDKNRAQMWRNAMRTRVMQQNGVNLHEASYSYHLPEEFLLILLELHRCREAVAGYGQEFLDYFTSHLSSSVSMNTNQSGKASAWAVSERQMRIQGYFDFDSEPEKGSRDGDQDAWMVSFAYTFTYNKPIEFNMRYPVVVHQQLIDQRYRPDEATYKIEAQKRYYSMSNLALERFSSDQQVLSTAGFEHTHIPEFDEVMLTHALPATICLCTVLTTITPEDRRTLFNLREMGNYALSDAVLNFIQNSEYPFLGKTYQSIIGMVLYEGHQAMPTASLVVDENLNVKATADLNLRKTYRVRLHLCADTGSLPVKAIARIQTDRTAAKQIADHLDAALRTVGSRKDLRKKQLSDDDYVLLTTSRYRPNHGRHSVLHYVLGLTMIPSAGNQPV